MSLPNILIADDEPEVRDILKNLLLKMFSCTFDLAEDGSKVVEKIKSGKFDLLLLDLKMPGLSGMDVIKEVVRLSPGTKIVVITAYDSREVCDRAIEAGASDYILKSYLKEEIGMKIKGILGVL